MMIEACAGLLVVNLRKEIQGKTLDLENEYYLE